MASQILKAAAAAGLLCSAISSAQAPAPAPTPANPDRGDERLCQQIVPTGSIMPKSYCFTREQWREFDKLTAEDAAMFLGRRTGGMCDINCGPGQPTGR